jgi:hypothetical protein
VLWKVVISCNARYSVLPTLVRGKNIKSDVTLQLVHGFQAIRMLPTDTVAINHKPNCETFGVFCNTIISATNGGVCSK